MNEKNEIKKAKFTEEQVMNAIMQMDSEQRKMLYANTFDTVMELANNPEYLKQSLNAYYVNAWLYINAIESVKAFIEKLNNQENTTPSVIDNLAEVYKGLSREERLEFGKIISDENNIINSLDMFKYEWNKMLNRFSAEK